MEQRHRHPNFLQKSAEAASCPMGPPSAEPAEHRAAHSLALVCSAPRSSAASPWLLNPYLILSPNAVGSKKSVGRHLQSPPLAPSISLAGHTGLISPDHTTSFSTSSCRCPLAFPWPLQISDSWCTSYLSHPLPPVIFST